MHAPTPRQDIDAVADAYAIRGAIDYNTVTATAYTGGTAHATHPAGRHLPLVAGAVALLPAPPLPRRPAPG